MEKDTDMEENFATTGTFMPPPDLPKETWAALKEFQDTAEKESGATETTPEQSTPLPSLKAGVTPETFWQKVGGVTAKYLEPPSFDSGRAGRIIPCDNVQDAIPLETSMERRVTKLEEQVDSLLDRIAKYNQRAQHRI